MMQPPQVAEVRSARAGSALYWWVITTDQREFYLRKQLYPDELAAFMEIDRQLQEQEQTNGHNP